jgi:capsular exopolysaccharide synthesis family protein
MVILAEALDNGVRTSDDVERLFDLRSLGAIPELKSTFEPGVRSRAGPTDFLVDKPMSAFAESFRSLRTSIAFSGSGGPVQVVVVTSSLPGEGKTTSAMCLARSAALGGLKAIIVDCDLRQRAVRRYIEQDINVGLVEVLSGSATLAQAVIKDSRTEAMILPIAGDVGVARDLFGGAAIEKLIAELRQHFDLIVLDTAPVLPIADTRMIAHQADAVIVLARWSKTPRKAIESSLRLLASTGAFIGGVVLTKVDMKAQARTGYGDSGYYYKDYKAYYG